MQRARLKSILRSIIILKPLLLKNALSAIDGSVLRRRGNGGKESLSLSSSLATPGPSSESQSQCPTPVARAAAGLLTVDLCQQQLVCRGRCLVVLSWWVGAHTTAIAAASFGAVRAAAAAAAPAAGSARRMVRRVRA